MAVSLRPLRKQRDILMTEINELHPPMVARRLQADPAAHR
jgi:hypothetical protein